MHTGPRCSLHVFAALGLLLVCPPARALDAPSAPGAPSAWAPAAKQFAGTAQNATSRVYFTGAQGVLTEVFYPTLDRVQNVDLQFLVTDAAQTWADEERKQKSHTVSLVNKRALVWQATTTADSKKWSITKKVFSDPTRNAVIQRVIFKALETGKTVRDYNVYVLNNPAIDNTGGGDTSLTRSNQTDTELVAFEHETGNASALAVSLPWHPKDGSPMVSSGFVGVNDGWSDLFATSNDHTMDLRYDAARSGNVAQMGWLDFGAGAAQAISFDVVLGFGGNAAEAMNTASATLHSDLAAAEQKYIQEWTTYTASLDNQAGQADDMYYLAAMILKTSQDKSSGAMIAGLGSPWGETQSDTNQGGYHLVWARDLFKFASALVAAGDRASAERAVEFLFDVQMNSATGRFPQNTFVDGRPYWNATQMDESAMPIILAWKLKRVDMWPKVKLAADFIVKNGPATEQDRWEEMPGYSPSTIAAEIAGLVCAASLAQAAHDPNSANVYLSKADEWRNNVAGWTFTTTGFHGNKRYYIRINANRDPNDDVVLAFGNGVGSHGERYIIDGGFLELVRMGAMSANDWTILDTLPEYDGVLKQTLKKGSAWFRYNFDGYGEHNDGTAYNGSGRGRLWPIFTAERGIYEISRSRAGSSGASYLTALKAFATPAGFIPEQIWNTSASISGWETTTPATERPGTATRSMRPLNWAMGEYINLISAMRQGHSDAPEVVVHRYATDKPQTTVAFNVQAYTQWGEEVYLVGDHALLSAWQPEAAIKLTPSPYPAWRATLSLPANTKFAYKYLKRDASGRVTWERVDGDNRMFTTPASGSIVRDETMDSSDNAHASAQP